MGRDTILIYNINVVLTYADVVSFALAIPYENQFGPTYGKEWILFNDEQNITQYVSLLSSTSTIESRTVQKQQVFFYLHTRNNKDISEELTIPTKNNTFTSQYYNASNPLIMVTHGFLSSTKAEWIYLIKDAYLRKGQYNVITVDWSDIASNVFYPTPANRTEYVGKEIAKLLDAICDSYQKNGSDIHLVGHSLGAQVMGHAGVNTKHNLSRITGLDPARPCFEFPFGNPYKRLKKGDAQFVDMIHTCAGLFGYLDPHGDADFYPNSGRPGQPGCTGKQESIESCSHGRATLYFAESIDGEIPFDAFPCESWKEFQEGKCKDNPVLMGEPLSSSARGVFYLYTNSDPKFARGVNTTEPKKTS